MIPIKTAYCGHFCNLCLVFVLLAFALQSESRKKTFCYFFVRCYGLKKNCGFGFSYQVLSLLGWTSIAASIIWNNFHLKNIFVITLNASTHLIVQIGCKLIFFNWIWIYVIFISLQELNFSIGSVLVLRIFFSSTSFFSCCCQAAICWNFLSAVRNWDLACAGRPAGPVWLHWAGWELSALCKRERNIQKYYLYFPRKSPVKEK